MESVTHLGGRYQAYCEIDHTGVFKWFPSNNIEMCPLFRIAYTYEFLGKRVRRFVTDFSSN